MTDENLNPKQGAARHKAPLRLALSTSLVEMSLALEDGAYKYGECNYRESNIALSVYIDATLRHLMALWNGEDFARDSRVKHAGHIMACMHVILDAEAHGTLVDDRPTNDDGDAVHEALDDAMQHLAEVAELRKEARRQKEAGGEIDRNQLTRACLDLASTANVDLLGDRVEYSAGDLVILESDDYSEQGWRRGVVLEVCEDQGDLLTEPTLVWVGDASGEECIVPKGDVRLYAKDWTLKSAQVPEESRCECECATPITSGDLARVTTNEGTSRLVVGDTVRVCDPWGDHAFAVRRISDWSFHVVGTNRLAKWTGYTPAS